MGEYQLDQERTATTVPKPILEGNSTILTKYNAIPRRRYRNTMTGRESIWLLDVLEKEVWINDSDACIHRAPAPFRNTMFRDIIVPLPVQVLTEDTLATFRTERLTRIDDDTLIGFLLELFEQVVAMEWEPARFHLILHSSGYDSRMLSETIRKLWLRNGDSWLGDVLFVCNKFEGHEFREIMEHQGWDESQYMVVGEDVPESEYHAPSLGFKDAWKKLNCIFGMPANIFYYLTEAAQNDGRAPADDRIQSWCNYLIPVDYTLKLDLEERYGFLYYHAMGGRNFKGENMEFPGAHPLFLSRAAGFVTDLKLNQIKREMVKALDPQLYELSETGGKKQGDWGRRLSRRLFEKAALDYRTSWYGSKVPAKPSWVVGFNSWWRRWSIASFCQHLVTNGYKLRMEKTG